MDDASTKENLGKKLGKDTLIYFSVCLSLKESALLLKIKNWMITPTKLNRTHMKVPLGLKF